MPINNSKISDIVLLTLKFVLELFSKTADKSEGLELIERRIGRVIEQWQKSQDRATILEPLIDLLQVLELAIESPENLSHKGMLSKSIKMVLDIFDILGAVEIEVKKMMISTPASIARLVPNKALNTPREELWKSAAVVLKSKG